jgi:hypothetical protein
MLVYWLDGQQGVEIWLLKQPLASRRRTLMYSPPEGMFLGIFNTQPPASTRHDVPNLDLTLLWFFHGHQSEFHQLDPI